MATQDSWHDWPRPPSSDHKKACTVDQIDYSNQDTVTKLVLYYQYPLPQATEPGQASSVAVSAVRVRVGVPVSDHDPIA